MLADPQGGAPPVAGPSRFTRSAKGAESAEEGRIMNTLTPYRRVLVESADPGARATQSAMLRAHGYDVVSCGGPASLEDPGCPMLGADGRCPLVDQADVVLYDLDLDKPDEGAVLDALRAAYPSRPVVAELPTAKAQRNADRLAGCTTFPPYDAARLVRGVAEATMSATPGASSAR